MQGVADYLKSTKRGSGRTTHLTNMDIRNGRPSLEDGLKMAREQDGRRPSSLDFCLDFLDLTEEDFLTLAMKHQVSPHEHRPELVQPGEPLPDMHLWDRTRIDKPVGPGRDAQGRPNTYV